MSYFIRTNCFLGF